MAVRRPTTMASSPRIVPAMMRPYSIAEAPRSHRYVGSIG